MVDNATLQQPSQVPESQDQNQNQAQGSVSPAYQPVEVKGRFNSFTSPYWALMLAVIGSIRYTMRTAVKAIDYLKNKPAKPVELKRADYLQPLSVVGLLFGITGFYATRTYGDMKRMFANNLADEFNKKPEDVNFMDFQRSKDTTVHEAWHNFRVFNLRRIGATILPVAFFMNKPALRALGGRDVADITVIGNGLYLANDVISRKATSFEEEQTLLATKINQSNRIGEQVTASDLINIYQRHVNNADPSRSLKDLRSTPQWGKVEQLFARIADLMNQTCGNTARREYVDFSIDKLLFLVGRKMIDPMRVDASLATVEVLNRYDRAAAKQVFKAVNGGMSLELATQQFPTQPRPDIPEISAQEAPLRKFTDRVEPAKPVTMQKPEESQVKRLENNKSSDVGITAV